MHSAVLPGDIIYPWGTDFPNRAVENVLSMNMV